LRRTDAQVCSGLLQLGLLALGNLRGAYLRLFGIHLAALAFAAGA